MEHVVLAMEEAGWDAELLERRLTVFDKRVRGVPMDEIARQVNKSRRTVYYDWEAISQVLAAAAAPEMEAIRSKAEARLERVYSLLMAEILSATKAGKSTVPALREARATVMAQAELRGAVDKRALAVIAANLGDGHELARKTDAELAELARGDLAVLRELAGFESSSGNGSGNGSDD